jgi:hypothetical protein
MAERPMFDDEYLPDWLVAGGITCAGRGAGRSDVPELPPWERPQPKIGVSLPDFAPPPEDAPPPWASGVEAPELPPFEAPAEAVPPIFQASPPDSEAESIVLDDLILPWEAEAPAAEGAPLDDPFSDLDWMRETPAAAPPSPDQPATPRFQTSWLSEAILPEAMQGGSETPASPTFQTSWLSEATPSAPQSDESLTDLFATSSETASEPSAAASDDWLRDFGAASDFDFPAADPDLTAASAPTQIKPPSFDWQSEGAAASEVAADSADWLRDFSVGDELEELEGSETTVAPDWLEASGVTAERAVEAAEPQLDWLTESAPAESPAFDQGAEELPDWLAESAPLVESAPAQAADDLPDWLRADESPAEASAEAEDIPDWLRTGYLEARPEPTAAQPEPQAEADLPDWMREFAPEPKSSGGLMGRGDDLAWLDQIDFEKPVAPQVADIPRPSRGAPRRPEPESGLDDPVLDAVLAQTSDLELSEPSLPSIDLDEEFDFETLPELPDAPAASEPPVPMRMPAAPVPPSKATGEAVVVAGDLPDWVAEMRPDSKPTLHIGDQEITLEERPLSALPEPILALRERLKQLPEPPAAPENPDSPLSGIAEVLQPPAFEAVPSPLTPSGALATAAQLAGVQTLRKIVAAQEEILKRRESLEISAPAHLKPRARLKFDRLLLIVFLIAAVVLPFFTDLANLVPPPRFAALDSASQARFTAINRAVSDIPRGASALVAFEYTPNAAAEMDDLARALLRDLIRREVKPILISTNPAASLHAYNLLYRLSRDSAEMATLGRNTPLAPRRDYIVLGYLPGGVSGVRALANALYDDSFQQQVIFGNDLEGASSGITPDQLRVLRAQPIFLLAQSQENVQTWVEQYRPPPNAPPDSRLRMVIATAAAATATAQTYAAAEPERIIGTLSGLRDALLYREVRAQYPSAEAQRKAEQRWQSVGFAAFAATLAILIGAALSMIQYLAQRRRSQ